MFESKATNHYVSDLNVCTIWFGPQLTSLKYQMLKHGPSCYITNSKALENSCHLPIRIQPSAEKTTIKMTVRPVSCCFFLVYKQDKQTNKIMCA